MDKNAIIKISFNPPKLDWRTNKQRRSKKPTCRWCGCPLTDPESIARGYGPRCYKDHSMIVLKIEPVEV